jgi:hypothetical protein
VLQAAQPDEGRASSTSSNDTGSLKVIEKMRAPMAADVPGNVTNAENE